MIKKPQRVYSNAKTNPSYPQWLRTIADHNAVLLKNGENPSDYPTQAVAFETCNFGWILSAPDAEGKRRILDHG